MKVVAYSCVAGFAAATPSPEVLTKFDEFRTKWGRTYSGEEYFKRAKFFEDTLQRIVELQRTQRGTAVFTYLAPFADWGPAEISRRFGQLSLGGFEGVPAAPLFNKSLASSFDWVPKGAVNPVKDQGHCGSCWAFSTACNLESTGFVSTGKLVSVSEQELVDCDKESHGCDGGDKKRALEWTSHNGGLASEHSYPYKAEDGSCKSGSVTAIIHNKGYLSISRDEDQMAQALTTYGAIAISVNAKKFHDYSHGVFDDSSCSTDTDHAINIVGYGTDNLEYWKIRNSWGRDFGEDGYIRVVRHKCMCGLCSKVFTATDVTVSGAGPTPPSPTPPTPPSPPGPSPIRWDCHDDRKSELHGDEDLGEVGDNLGYCTQRCEEKEGCVAINWHKTDNHCHLKVGSYSHTDWDSSMEDEQNYETCYGDKSVRTEVVV